MLMTSPPSERVNSQRYAALERAWRHTGWSPASIDLHDDFLHWHDVLDAEERAALLWQFSMFLWAEEVMFSAPLTTYISAAPLACQRDLLLQQQIDEGRHASFFARFLHDVCGVGDGTVRNAIVAIQPTLTSGFLQMSGHLDHIVDRLRHAPTSANLAAAVTTYHIVLEASFADPAEKLLSSFLRDRGVLPGLRDALAHVAEDEARHVGLGTALLADLLRDEGSNDAVLEWLSEIWSSTREMHMAPHDDERHLAIFGVTLDAVRDTTESVLQAKLMEIGIDHAVSAVA